MANDRRSGLEITSSRSVSPSAATAATPKAPGEILFDLVFSNESLWSTVDPHAAQELVEAALRTKGVVDLGDLLGELIVRKTDPSLARGTVLTFAMELARSGIAVRLPAELQGLDRNMRQQLVERFRGGQKRDEEATQTAARQPAPSTPPRRTSGPNPAARGPSGPNPAAPDVDGWARGIAEISDPRAASKSAAADLRAQMSGKTAEKAKRESEKTGEVRAPRERTKTSVARPSPGAKGFSLGAMTPGRIGALGVSAVLFLAALVAGPAGNSVVTADLAVDGGIPCARVERKGAHLFCIVDPARVSADWTQSDIDAFKAKAATGARAAGIATVTFYNADYTRWDPTPAPPRMEMAGVPTGPAANEGEVEEERRSSPSSSMGSGAPSSEELMRIREAEEAHERGVDEEEEPERGEEPEFDRKKMKKKKKSR